MIERTKYLKQLVATRGNGFPKVVTGIRRCGKSYLLKEIYRPYLINSGVAEENILSIDLDDESNALLRNPLELGSIVRNWAKGKDQTYVFLDEIQLVNTIINPAYTNGKIVVVNEKGKNNDQKRDDTISFVDVVLGLSKQDNIDLYVTGSNSKMLSTDIATEFRDKATIIEMAPLSFSEFCAYRGLSPYESLQEYMSYGGMPLAVLKENEEEKRNYLKKLFEMTYFKDIIERYGVQKSESLGELTDVLSASVGSLLNVDKIIRTFQSAKHEKLARETVDKYIEALKDAFLLREARRYDMKGRKEIGALKKYYFTDTGLRNARLDFAFPDEGQMLENIVYNELIYHDWNVSVGSFDSFSKNEDGKTTRKSNAIDFYAKKGLRRICVQVTAEFSTESTREREIRPYLLLNDQTEKIVVIARPSKAALDQNGFLIISAEDFLLRFLEKE